MGRVRTVGDAARLGVMLAQNLVENLSFNRDDPCTPTPKQDEMLAQSLMVNALEGRRRGGKGVSTFKVAIWVALLAAVLSTGCSQASRQERGSGTTEHSPTAPERQA